jgi:hypothetical protein
MRKIDGIKTEEKENQLRHLLSLINLIIRSIRLILDLLPTLYFQNEYSWKFTDESVGFLKLNRNTVG